MKKAKRIAALAVTIEDKIDDAAKEYIDTVAERAAAIAPVRTGKLKNSIKVRKFGKGRYEMMVNAHYGIYVEYGTRNMAPQPYVRPAVRFARKKLKNDLRGVVRSYKL